ncbi:hypothetical protein ALC56_01101 [Trachymyrmex septentrionalis]|uniref:Uncharacterized protein n=1 Tax=Trachymyrmex septentrionalis TaxID=34720 RepID=A0A195FVB5_9HYME|nr:hypothetical protein ALC56_01101 [Trachymyrmex septentrionalis]
MRGAGERRLRCVFLFRRKKERQKAIGSLRGNIAISISAPTSRNTRNDLRSGAWCFDGGQPEVNLRFTRQDHRPKGELKGWRGGGEEEKRKERKGRKEQGREEFATMDRPRSRNRAAVAKGVAVASLEQREAAGPDPTVSRRIYEAGFSLRKSFIARYLNLYWIFMVHRSLHFHDPEFFVTGAAKFSRTLPFSDRFLSSNKVIIYFVVLRNKDEGGRRRDRYNLMRLAALRHARSTMAILQILLSHVCFEYSSALVTLYRDEDASSMSSCPVRPCSVHRVHRAPCAWSQASDNIVITNRGPRGHKKATNPTLKTNF